MDDNEIIRLFQKRDESALRLTEKKYSRYLYTIAHNVLKNHEDSCECVNDTYLKAWNSIPPDVPRQLAFYLGKIARGLSIGRLRKNNALKRGGSQYSVSLEELKECAAANASPEHEADAMLLAGIISDFLRDCSDTARMVFIRRYYFCDSVGFIAEGEGLSVSNVKVTLMRTRESLKKRLEKEGYTV